jgi:hypothetical protein
LTSFAAKKTIVAVLAALLLSLTGVQDAAAKPTRQEMKQAKALFNKAEAAAAKKDYIPSADFYLRAYELFPSTDFIFNAASMFRLADDETNARKYFEEYLALDSKGRGAAEARSALAYYNAQRKKEKEREEAEAREAAKADAASKDKKEKDTTLLKNNTGTSDRKKSSSNLPAIISVSAGGLLVGGGIYFALRSKSISDEVSDSPVFDPALEKKGEDAARNAYIFGGIGAAAIVGGVVLYVLGGKEKANGESLTIAPAINGESIGAFAYGQF